MEKNSAINDVWLHLCGMLKSALIDIFSSIHTEFHRLLCFGTIDGSGPKSTGRARALKVGLGPGPGLSPSLKAGLRAGLGPFTNLIQKNFFF